MTTFLTIAAKISEVFLAAGLCREFLLLTCCAIKKSDSGRQGGKNGKAAGRIHTIILLISYRPYRLTGNCIYSRILFNKFNSSFKILIAQRVTFNV